MSTKSERAGLSEAIAGAKQALHAEGNADAKRKLQDQFSVELYGRGLPMRGVAKHLGCSFEAVVAAVRGNREIER